MSKLLFHMQSGETYAALSVLGRGSNGVVFKCMNTKTLAVVALKRVSMLWVAAAAADGAGAYYQTEMFENETSMMQLLGDSHPNIVPIRSIQLSAPNGAFGFIEMSYAGSRSLNALINGAALTRSGRRISPGLSKRYVWQILSALAYAHEKGIWHRDIKPENVIVSDDGKDARLIDWGLGTPTLDAGEYTTDVQTIYYRAPELFMDNDRYTETVDSWGVGCILFMLLGDGALLFDAETELHMLGQISDETKLDSKTRGARREKALPPESQCPGARDLLDRLLCFDYTKRVTAKEALGHVYFRAEVKVPLLLPVSPAQVPASAAMSDVKTPPSAASALVVTVIPAAASAAAVAPIGKVTAAAQSVIAAMRKDKFLTVPPPRSP